MDEFDISRFRTTKNLTTVARQLYDADIIIRATFKAMDYPIEMYDFITDAHRAGKTTRLVEVRRACMWALRKFSDLSLIKIGKKFDLHHATVIHHINVFDGWLDADDAITIRTAKDIEWSLEEHIS
jgi:chromosomal replication initiation ATPase DnaA